MKNFTNLFRNKTILIIGDVMLDEYVFGNITRMSPEAPKTPVILVDDRKYALGGASNVANNVVSLGGKAILLGCLGNDNNGKIFQELLQKARIKNRSFVSSVRPTTTKTRVFYDGHQITRIDTEKSKPLNHNELKLFVASLQNLPHNIDFVIISDYAKGMFSATTLRLILKRFSGDKIIADIKPIHKNLVKKLYAITPNLKELSAMAGTKLRRHDSIRNIATALAKELDTSVIATLGHEGMIACDKQNLAIYRTPAPKIKAIDVTGAGDVATAACALALASGASLKEAAELAVQAASLSVTKLGTSTVTLKEVGKR